MTKPTKQQIIEALKGMRVTYHIGEFIEHDAGAIADILVKAGYAEEPREKGRYQVKWHSRAAWQEAIWNGDNWATPTRPRICDGHASWRNEYGEPAIIGPRITPPEDK